MFSYIRLGFGLTAALLLTACAASSHAPSPKAAGTGAKATEVRIHSGEFSYEPNTVRVEAGRPIRLVLDNSRGTIEHDLSIPERGVYLKAGAGKTADRRVVFDQPGQYSFRCSLPGHGEAGMTGVFNVAAGAAGTVPSAETVSLSAGSEETVGALPAGLSRLPQPSALPPPGRHHPELVKVALEANGRCNRFS